MKINSNRLSTSQSESKLKNTDLLRRDLIQISKNIITKQNVNKNEPKGVIKNNLFSPINLATHKDNNVFSQNNKKNVTSRKGLYTDMQNSYLHTTYKAIGKLLTTNATDTTITNASNVANMSNSKKLLAFGFINKRPQNMNPEQEKLQKFATYDINHWDTIIDQKNFNNSLKIEFKNQFSIVNKSKTKFIDGSNRSQGSMMSEGKSVVSLHNKMKPDLKIKVNNTLVDKIIDKNISPDLFDSGSFLDKFEKSEQSLKGSFARSNTLLSPLKSNGMKSSVFSVKPIKKGLIRSQTQNFLQSPTKEYEKKINNTFLNRLNRDKYLKMAIKEGVSEKQFSKNKLFQISDKKISQNLELQIDKSINTMNLNNLHLDVILNKIKNKEDNESLTSNTKISARVSQIIKSTTGHNSNKKTSIKNNEKDSRRSSQNQNIETKYDFSEKCLKTTFDPNETETCENIQPKFHINLFEIKKTGNEIFKKNKYYLVPYTERARQKITFTDQKSLSPHTNRSCKKFGQQKTVLLKKTEQNLFDSEKNYYIKDTEKKFDLFGNKRLYFEKRNDASICYNKLLTSENLFNNNVDVTNVKKSNNDIQAS